MGNKIFKKLIIIFIILILFAIVLIGYRMSIVLKIPSSRNKILESDNVKVVSEIKSSDENWEQKVIYKKGNISRVQFISDFETNKPSTDIIFDFDKKIQININEKMFFVSQDNLIDLTEGWYSYPVVLNFPSGYQKKLKDYLQEFGYYVILALTGNPRYFIDENGREAISLQIGSCILYFDRDTGICYEEYIVNEDGTKELKKKYNVEFGAVTDEDIDYGDLNEFYQWVVAE